MHCARGLIRPQKVQKILQFPDIAWKDIYQRIFISYILSKNREKGYSPITFLSGICWGIWYPNFRHFKVLYPILSSILFRKNWQFWGTFALQNAFFVLLNTEINCEFPLNLISNTRRMLRYAPRFQKKKFKKKNFTKKNFTKFFVHFFFQIFFWLSRFHIIFGACLPKFGGSRPASLGGDRERTDST
jgi:hypothetical protein